MAVSKIMLLCAECFDLAAIGIKVFGLLNDIGHLTAVRACIHIDCATHSAGDSVREFHTAKRMLFANLARKLGQRSAAGHLDERTVSAMYILGVGDALGEYDNSVKALIVKENIASVSDQLIFIAAVF